MPCAATLKYLHLQETGAVAMGEDWKLEPKQKEMQQAKVGHVKR